MDINIKNVQQRLNQLGFVGPTGRPLVEDGVKGPNTSFAVISFKKSIGLRARDYIGPLTYAALMRGPATPAGDPEGKYTDIPWLAEAMFILSIHEKRDTSRLKKWFDKSVAWIDPREIPWCGAFEATIMRKAFPGIDLPDNPLGAKNWSKFGQPCKPQLGCTLTFHRGSPSDWRGHVCNYLGESPTAYYVIGGNQTDAVTRTWISKSRLHSARWPSDFPLLNKRVTLDSSGQVLSTDEA
jgi:uncharacterized protein (TIGR02594 family)